MINQNQCLGHLEGANNRIFKNKAHDLIKLLDYVKFMSFSWLKAKLFSSAFSYNDWWRNPLLCMGIRE